MTEFRGKIINKNGYPTITFEPSEYKVEEIRDILFAMYNYLVDVDFMQIFTTNKIPNSNKKRKKLKR